MNLSFAFFLIAISLIMGKGHEVIAQSIEIAFEHVDSLTAQEERLLVVLFTVIGANFVTKCSKPHLYTQQL